MSLKTGAMMSTSTTSRGFTLVEALAALLLIAIVLPFVMRGISVASRGAAETDRQATATMLAQTKMDEAILGSAWQFGDNSGSFDPAYGSEAERYTWELTVGEWLSTDFRELTMTVRWESGRGERAVTLKTVVYAGA